ncbi:hypothetical protein FHW79_006080 [Azospirillum sp. OGB3]|uniref:DDE-type integrase/transposase/recombinase n=1 Tax=Azospirillum sp. OGB3 TaxID=2587012 RepID=UPI0016059BFC|nr:DDE-type integrase/transposase/recombinase [Azospirillum sp. OGB3]MBB3268405.1 hypothetical protein [Azospirillum sp. OGB3]
MGPRGRRGASLERTRAPLGRARDSGVYGGLQFVVPPGDLSLEQAEVGANVAWCEAELRLEALRHRIEKEVRDAVRNAQTRWRQLELARRSRDLARRKIDVENQKLKVGRLSNFQMLSFEADLRNAENALLSAVIAYAGALTAGRAGNRGGTRRRVDWRWCVDETYPKVGERWCWPYRGIDSDGAQVDVPISEHRDRPPMTKTIRR